MSGISRALFAAADNVEYDALYRAHRDDENFCSELVEICADPQFERPALWMLKRYLESDGRIDADLAAQLFARFDGLQGWDAQLLALQCLPWLEVPPELRARVEAFVRIHLAGNNKFLRAWAYNGFDLLARQYPGYRDEADTLLEMGLRDEPPAIKARIRNILKSRQ